MSEEKFEYKYSMPNAEERREILKIQQQYSQQTKLNGDDKVLQLKNLDRQVKMPAKAVAITMGVVGFCCFGLGMAMTLEWNMLLWGALVGVVGLALMAPAYWVHNRIFAKRKAKYADKILELTHDILGKEDDNVSIDIAETKEQNQKEDETLKDKNVNV